MLLALNKPYCSVGVNAMEETVEYDEIGESIVRYVDEYNWGWGIIHKQIRRCFGRDLKLCELQRIYKQAKNKNNFKRG